MLETYTSLIERDFQNIWTLLKERKYAEAYQHYGPVLENMLGVYENQEWLDYLDQQGLEERSLRLYLAAWQNCCLRLGGYEGDVTEKIAGFFRRHLPEELFQNLELFVVDLDIDEPSQELEPQLEFYREQLEPWGCRMKVFFDDTYCVGEYFLFLETPSQW